MDDGHCIRDRLDPERGYTRTLIHYRTADPVFDPIAAGVAKVDANVAAPQVQEIFNSGSALESAYSGEYSLISSVLFDNAPAPQGRVDPTTLP